MEHQFSPFTPDRFKEQTGLNAYENEAVHIRWVNSQIHYATYQSIREMTESLKEIIRLLRNGALDRGPGTSK